jgi:hypothetical protein
MSGCDDCTPKNLTHASPAYKKTLWINEFGLARPNCGSYCCRGFLAFSIRNYPQCKRRIKGIKMVLPKRIERSTSPFIPPRFSPPLACLWAGLSLYPSLSALDTTRLVSTPSLNRAWLGIAI